MSTQRFHITLWPEGRFVIPRVRPVEVRIATGSVVSPRFFQDTQELPEEAYLRELFDLDLSSHESIAAFTRSWGWLGDDGFDLDLQPDAGYPVEVSHGEGRSVDDWYEPTPAVCFPIAEEVGFLDLPFRERVASDLMNAGYSVGLRTLWHLDEFKLYASCLRDAVRVYQAISGSREWTEIFSLWETPREWLSVSFELLDSPTNRAGAARFLRDVVNGGLSEFRVHLDLHLSEPNGMSRPWEESSLFSALCVQLANHISENATYHVCANETCRRYFVHQRGMAKYGQYKNTGVLYCSPTCAKAQAQRKYRRNQPKKRGKSA